MNEEPDKPEFLAVDHISWTVADLEAALTFYRDVVGAEELFRLGPLDAADMPLDSRNRDWTERHVGIPGARLTLVMMRIADSMNFQLVQYDKPDDRRLDLPRNCDRGGHHLALRVDDVPKAIAYLTAHGCTALDIIEVTDGPLAGKKNVYMTDPFGHSLEIVD